jgi:hypothetical protein
MMERQLELERQWELYRRSVIESMAGSDYKTAVLAAIEHKLMMLDRMEDFSLYQRRHSNAHYSRSNGRF